MSKENKPLESVETSAKFVPVSTIFDPLMDIEEVDQFGFVDLREAFLNGSVPGDIVADETKYNGIEDPDAVGSRADDQFAAIRNAQALTAAEAAAASRDKAASSAGEE